MKQVPVDESSYPKHYKEVYNEDARFYDQSRFGDTGSRHAKQVKNDLILDILDRNKLLSEDTRIIDIATGTGRIAHDLVKKNFSRVFAADISRGMLEQNKANLDEKYHGKMAWTNANMKSLPFPDNSFDVVTIGSFFYLIPLDEYHGFTTDIHRILKPNGLFICEVSNTMGIFNPFSAMKVLIHKYWKKKKVKSYVNPWNIRRLFRNFSLEDFYGVEYPVISGNYGFYKRLTLFLGRFPITRLLGGKFLLVLRKR
jgi:ubiquinone/menaquinone biosynthesis C-methylase UbiE